MEQIKFYRMFLVLFTVLCVVGALFVLPVIVMVVFLLFKKNSLIYGGFSSGDFRAVLNRMISEMYGAGYAGNATRGTTGSLSRCEALEILGLGDGATPEQITSAYHRLMKFAHPDRGGSAYFAQKLNQARDTLLGNN